MDCFSEITDAHKLCSVWGVAPVHSTRGQQFFETEHLQQTEHVYAHACRKRGRTNLLYLWLISDSYCTNIINQAD